MEPNDTQQVGGARFVDTPFTTPGQSEAYSGDHSNHPLSIPVEYLRVRLVQEVWQMARQRLWTQASFLEPGGYRLVDKVVALMTSTRSSTVSR